MTAYRVLVSHRDLKMKTVVHLEPTTQVQYLVDAGYLKPIEEVQHVEGTGVTELRGGNVDSDHDSVDLPRRRRKAVKPEVSDVEGGPVSDGDPTGGQG